MSKTITKETGDAVAARVIAEAKAEARAAEAAIRKGCGHALRAGLRLIWLHQTMEVTNGRNQYSEGVSRETPTFENAVEEIGLKRATAYRWMSACGAALQRATFIMEAEDLREMPEPGTRRWEMWEEELAKISEQMTLNRLVLGASKGGSDLHRISEMTDAVEEGRLRAVELMEAVELGRYTLAQAVKALGSQEAYDRLREEGREKIRKDPMYLDMDNKKQLKGLIPRALTTLRNGFEKWEELPPPARGKVRALWLEVIAVLPDEMVDAG